MRVLLTTAASALLLLTPAALAGLTLEAGPATLAVEDGEGSPCHEQGSEPCILVLEGGSPGESTIDAYQSVSAVRVGVESPLPGARDVGAEANLSHVTLPNPVFPLLTEAYGALPRPSGLAPLRAPEFDETGFSIYTVAPRGSDPLNPAEQEARWEYGRGRGVGYDEVGPVNAPRGQSTDVLLYRGFEDFACGTGTVGGPGCERLTSSATALAKATTPNIRLGLEVYGVEAEVGGFDGFSRGVASTAPVGPQPAGYLGAVPSLEPAPSRAALAVPPTLDPGAPGSSGDAGLASESAEPGSRDALDVLGVPRAPASGIPAVTLLLAATGLAVAWLAVALYSRFSTSREALRSPVRVRLYELVLRNPGMPWMEAARSLGVTRNAVAHHVRILERAGILRVADEAGRLHLYVTGTQAPRADGIPPSLLAHPVRGQILQMLRESPAGVSREEVSQRLASVPERTRRHNIGRLLALGLVEEREGPGGERRLRLVASPGASAIAFGSDRENPIAG